MMSVLSPQLETPTRVYGFFSLLFFSLTTPPKRLLSLSLTLPLGGYRLQQRPRTGFSSIAPNTPISLTLAPQRPREKERESQIWKGKLKEREKSVCNPRDMVQKLESSRADYTHIATREKKRGKLVDQKKKATTIFYYSYTEHNPQLFQSLTFLRNQSLSVITYYDYRLLVLQLLQLQLLLLRPMQIPLYCFFLAFRCN